MKVRWLSKKTHVTADEVRLYAHDAQVSMMEAKRVLENLTPPMLQYLCVNEWESYWEDVPFVTEYRNDSKDKS